MADMEYKNGALYVDKIDVDGNYYESINDPEDRRNILLDSSNKIISYIDANGNLVEKVGVYTPKINGQSIESIIYQAQHKDLRLPVVNVTSDNLQVIGNDIIGLTISKNEVECTVEFISNEKWFKEDECLIAYQGNSTLHDVKKGFSLIFPSKHRFKNWIEMDEYRLKGYGQDWTSGIDVVANRLYSQVLATREFETNKPWKKYNDFAQDDISLLMDFDKKACMDGFPCELYINGNYWGIYSFNIRKERGNYNLNKKDKKHIQIEGEDLRADSRFTWDTIEIRNPKGYEEYVEPEDGDPVKEFITNWFNGISEITQETTEEELEEYLDCENFIDWYLHNAFISGHDVINKNTEFTTWDRKHMSLLPQDLNGAWADWMPYNYDELSQKAYDYCSWLRTALDILNDRIKTRYAVLRQKGVFSIENLTKLWEDWCSEIGTDAYEDDQKRWSRKRKPVSDKLTKIKNRIGYLDTKFEYSA